MITLNDVEKIFISPLCLESMPCIHNVQVVLKDGRSVCKLDNFEINAIISNLALEKINPAQEEQEAEGEERVWTAEIIKQHFSLYNHLNADLATWSLETPETVLNRIFMNVVIPTINENSSKFIVDILPEAIIAVETIKTQAAAVVIAEEIVDAHAEVAVDSAESEAPILDAPR